MLTFEEWWLKNKNNCGAIRLDAEMVWRAAVREMNEEWIERCRRFRANNAAKYQTEVTALKAQRDSAVGAAQVMQDVLSKCQYELAANRQAAGGSHESR